MSQMGKWAQFKYDAHNTLGQIAVMSVLMYFIIKRNGIKSVAYHAMRGLIK